MNSLLFDADFAHILLLLAVVLGATLAHKVAAVETLHLLVEDEEEAGKAPHAAVLIEGLLPREDGRLLILRRHYLVDLTATDTPPRL